MALALKAASQFYELCETQPMFMSPQASRKALALMETLLKQYSIFHTKTSENGQWYCNIVPKCHHSWHMADAARFTNPRHCWTYKCESWVGKISTTAASCAHGTRSSALTPSLAAKYRVMVCVSTSGGSCMMSRSLYMFHLDANSSVSGFPKTVALCREPCLHSYLSHLSQQAFDDHCPPAAMFVQPQRPLQKLGSAKLMW